MHPTSLDECKSPSRWRMRKMSTKSNHGDFSGCVSTLSKFCKQEDRRRLSETALMSSPSRRLRTLRAQRTEELAESLFKTQTRSRNATPRNLSDEQDTSAPQVELSWNAIDFRYVKCGSCVSSEIQLKSTHDRPLIVRLTLDTRKQGYSTSEIWPLINQERHIHDDLKKELLDQDLQNTQSKLKVWKFQDPKTKNRQNSVSIFLKPREEVGVKVFLKVPDESTPGSLLSTMVDLTVMGGKKLKQQNVLLIGRVEQFPIAFSNQIYSEEHKVKVIPLVAKYSRFTEVIKKYKLTFTNTNLYQRVEVQLFPMNISKDQYSHLVDVLVTPTTIKVGPGLTKSVQVYLRMKKRRDTVEVQKILKALVGVSSASSFVYGLYLEIQILSNE